MNTNSYMVSETYDYEKSAKLNNISVDKLKIYLNKYPKSNKKVIRICDKCGREKEIYFNQYRDLCNKCANNDIKKCEQHSIYLIEYYSDPEHIKENSDRMLKYHIDNPNAGKQHSERLIEINKNNPNIGKDHSIFMNEYWSYQENRNAAAGRTTEYFKTYPEALIEMSERTLQYYKDHPEKGIEHSIFMLNMLDSDPTMVERYSARSQGQDYDAGEWTGFTDHGRPHLIPASRCLHLNSWFEGCVRHHIMSGVVIHIPVDLHRSVRHRMPNGDIKSKNMKEINKLAFEYLFGKL